MEKSANRLYFHELLSSPTQGDSLNGERETEVEGDINLVCFPLIIKNKKKNTEHFVATQLQNWKHPANANR